MRKLIILLPLLLIGCSVKEHYAAQRAIAKDHYSAYDTPIAVTECNGVKTTIYRQNITSFVQEDTQLVKVVKETAGVLKSPVSAVIATGLAVLPNAGGNTRGDVHVGDGDFKPQTEIIEVIKPEAEGE